MEPLACIIDEEGWDEISYLSLPLGKPLPTRTRPRRIRTKGTQQKLPADRIDNLLRDGKPPHEVATILKIHVGYVEERRKLLRAELAGGSGDSSSSRFNKDELFVALVLAHGGLPTAQRLPHGTIHLGPNGTPWKPRTPNQAELDDIHRKWDI